MHAVYQEQIVGHLQIYLQRFEKSHIYECHMLLSYVVQSVLGNIAHIKKEKNKRKKTLNPQILFCGRGLIFFFSPQVPGLKQCDS